MNCCSPDLIALHYVQPGMLHVFDFLVYNSRVAGKNDAGDKERLKENRAALQIAKVIQSNRTDISTATWL